MHVGKYDSRCVDYANQALQSDSFSQTGEGWVEAFENSFARTLGSTYGVAVNSATSGLHAALIACGVKEGDEVISPGLTVVMDAFSTIYSGAEPVFCDVSPIDWNLDPEKVIPLITSRTKAIISVSWFGLPAKNRRLREICDSYGLILIDDSAETISKQDSVIQNWKFAHLRVYSFESKKHFSTGGEGGMVLTDDPELAKQVRKVAGIGYKHLDAKKGRTSLASRVFQNPNYERFDQIGFNYRMTPVTAALGLAQLERLDVFLQSRITSAKYFMEATKPFEWLNTQPELVDGMRHTYYTFGTYLSDDRPATASWQTIYDLFVSRGGHGFYANCKNPYLEPVFLGKKLRNQNLMPGLCPEAEKLQLGIMAFKTNYLDMRVAEKQAEILQGVLESL